MQNEAQIFDILDGTASPEVIFEHKNLLKTSPEYLAYFKELEALHKDLTNMNLENPSAQFTEILLQNLGIATAKKKSWATNSAFVFAGIMLFIIVLSVIFLGKSAIAENPVSTKLVHFSAQLFNANFVRILLIINALLLLLVIDRKVFRPFFEKRRMSF